MPFRFDPVRQRVVPVRRLRAVPVQGRRLAPLDEAERRRHKRRNWLQSALLLAGMAGLVALSGWLLFGAGGMVWLGLGALVLLLFSPTLSPAMVLRLYRARPLHPAEIPALTAILPRLAERAGLPVPPRLHYVPSALSNAFAVGGRDDAAIALTDGLLRRLTVRELAAVLAHEISHIRNHDLWLMNLADVAGRLTRALSLIGTMAIVLSLPVWVMGGVPIPVQALIAFGILLLAPQLTLLLQLALSRSREFDADLDAAGLTGDPEGLVSALHKLERHRRGLIEQLCFPGYRLPEPSHLRTHPRTEDRVARLRALMAQQDVRDEPGLTLRGPWPAPVALRAGPVTAPPRIRLIGFWH